MTVPYPGDTEWWPALPWTPPQQPYPTHIPPAEHALLSEILVELRAIRELMEKRDA